MPFSEKNAERSLNTPFFGTLNKEQFELFKKNASLSISYYMQGEEIIKYSRLRTSFAAMVADGKVSLKAFDEAGNLLDEEILKKGTVVGEVFGMSPLGVNYVLSAKSDCNLYFFNPQSIFTPWGGKANEKQMEFLSYLMSRVSLRLEKREERLLMLKKSTTREKLLAFLKSEAKRANSQSFRIKMSQTELSEYLLINRSALAREISRLNREGVIKSNGKNFTLL